MEAQRGSLSLLVLFLTVLLDSGTAGKSHSACEPGLGALKAAPRASSQAGSRTLRTAPQRRATGDSSDVSRPV